MFAEDIASAAAHSPVTGKHYESVRNTHPMKYSLQMRGNSFARPTTRTAHNLMIQPYINFTFFLVSIDFCGAYTVIESLYLYLHTLYCMYIYRCMQTSNMRLFDPLSFISQLGAMTLSTILCTSRLLSLFRKITICKSTQI